jgi:hypothetical protein
LEVLDIHSLIARSGCSTTSPHIATTPPVLWTLRTCLA